MNVFDLVIQDKETVALADVSLNETNANLIVQFLKEHKYQDVLIGYGLPVNNKIILHGASGCGKTMTAKAIAGSLGKPIQILNLSTIVQARVGETSQNLKQIFDKAARDKAVLFLDEFDQIGKERVSDEKDIGEMRRLVNTLIQLIDYLPSTSILIAATNHLEILDLAIRRRFQLQLEYSLPTSYMLDNYYDSLLSRLPAKFRNIIRKYNLSFAEVKDYTFTTVKSNIISSIENED